ncbi:MAG TPA: PilN domain-containing protein [Candidatus Saccharimonadales bacterium]|nr:PilN domain-containing protein [Candidatus Saccharimonadales bacterium]
MINLLPPELKEQYTYGRRNMTMRRWAALLVATLAGVAVVTFGGLFYMEKSIADYRSQVAAAEKQLKDQNLEQTRTQSKDITGSIKLATDVLSKEILFSQLLTQIARVVPPNTNLTELSITKDEKAIEIKAISADYISATQLQVNLQDPANKIFSKADIQSITCNNTQDPRYPCAVTIRALFNDDNPYLFINKTGATL